MDKQKDTICPLIMDKIACCEEKRLIRSLFLMGFLLIVTSWLVIVTIHISIMHFRSEETSTSVLQYFSVLTQLFWSQMQKDLVILLLSAISILLIVAFKVKLFSFPFRFREVKKYKVLRSKSPTVNV